MGHVRDVGVNLDHIFESRACCGQGQLQIFEYLSRLRCEISLAHDFSGLVERNLAGDVDCPAAEDFDHMTVAGRRRQRRWVGMTNLHISYSWALQETRLYPRFS